MASGSLRSVRRSLNSRRTSAGTGMPWPRVLRTTPRCASAMADRTTCDQPRSTPSTAAAARRPMPTMMPMSAIAE